MINLNVYKVGGQVRDTLLGLIPADYDYVVVGSNPDEMESYGFLLISNPEKGIYVYSHPDTQDEYVLARIDKKVDVGHNGFVAYSGSDVTLEQDLYRRDLTINSMAFDKDNNLIDPYNGFKDLTNKMLRHTSEAFVEDPLRVLRVARFYARYKKYGFTIALETLKLMSDICLNEDEIKSIPKERIRNEFMQALMTDNPECFIDTLYKVGALKIIMPAVANLHGVEQPVAHHPEGCAYTHTLYALKQCVAHSAPLEVRWATLLHDVGKAYTPKDKWPRHINHDVNGVIVANHINASLGIATELSEISLLTTEYHIKVHRCMEFRANTLYKLLKSLDVIRRPNRLEHVLEACRMDAIGRHGFENKEYPQKDYLLSAAKAIRELKADIDSKKYKGISYGIELEKARINHLYKFKMEYNKCF